MSLTLEQIRLRTRFALGLRKSDGFTALPNPLLDHLVNQAQLELRLLLRDRTENYFTDALGKRSEDLPPDFLADIEVWAGRDPATGFQGYRVVPMPYRELVAPGSRFDPDNPATGTPQRYSIVSSDYQPDSFSTGVITAGDNFKAGQLINGSVITVGQIVTTTMDENRNSLLFLDPIPAVDSRLDVFYLPMPVDLSADDDEPDFDEIYHESVLAKTREKAAIEIGDLTRWAALTQITVPLLVQHRILANQRRSSNTVQMRVSY